MRNLITRIFLITVTILATLLSTAGVPEAGQGEWETISKPGDSVTVYRKQVPGSSVLAFKGITTVDLHIGKLLTVYTDSSTQKDWVDRFDSSGDLRIITSLERTYWIRFGLPFPISDRDYVLNINGNLDHANRVFVADLKSVEDPERPEDDCCVRGIAFGTYYKFEALPGEKTRLTVEVHTDPMGLLPAWFVNLIQKGWPAKTLGGLVERSRRKDVRIYAGMENWHNDTASSSAESAALSESFDDSGTR